MYFRSFDYIDEIETYLEITSKTFISVSMHSDITLTIKENLHILFYFYFYGAKNIWKAFELVHAFPHNFGF